MNYHPNEPILTAFLPVSSCMDTGIFFRATSVRIRYGNYRVRYRILPHILTPRSTSHKTNCSVNGIIHVHDSETVQHDLQVGRGRVGGFRVARLHRLFVALLLHRQVRPIFLSRFCLFNSLPILQSLDQSREYFFPMHLDELRQCGCYTYVRSHRQ